MRLMKLCCWVMCGAMLGGCMLKKKEPPVASPVPSTDMVSGLRTRYAAMFPHARIGVVSAVLNDADYGTVNDIDTAGLKVGDILQIIDATETKLADARVAQIGDKSITITFTTAGPRRPAVGDVAVRF